MMRHDNLLAFAFILTLGPSIVSAQPVFSALPGPPGSVTLPLAEYDRLIERAARPIPVPERPPLPAVISRANLEVRVSGNGVRGTFRLDGEVFESGTSKVRLISQATLLDAQIAGLPLPLIQQNGEHSSRWNGARR
jgi:hypothetical protein